MATSTYNQAEDLFGLETTSSNALKVVASNENRTATTATGQNSYGDARAVDVTSSIASPSAEYEVCGALTHSSFGTLGSVSTPTSLGFKVAMGTVTISTQTGSAPTVSVSGQQVPATATALREYTLPTTLAVSPRHRAQDMLSACTIKVGSTDASDATDYGLESVTATFPIEFSVSQPKGALKSYDLRGGVATLSYTMNWYSSTAPTIALSTAAANAGYEITSPVTKGDPKNGYTQYTWTVSFPFTGSEAD